MSKQRGMSLVEVLLAMAILGLVLLSIVGLFTEAVTLNASGMDYTSVNNLARDRLEQLLARPFDHADISVSGWVGGMSRVRVEPDSDTLPLGSPFQRQYEVREYRLEKIESAASGNWQTQLTTPVNPGAGNIKEITVIVTSGRPFIGRREIRVVGYKCNGLF